MSAKLLPPSKFKEALDECLYEIVYELNFDMVMDLVDLIDTNKQYSDEPVGEYTMAKFSLALKEALYNDNTMTITDMCTAVMEKIEGQL